MLQLRFLFCFILLTMASLAQEETEAFSWGPKDAFHVYANRLIEDTLLLHGSYEALLKSQTWASGQFLFGKKTGQWSYFFPGGAERASGQYSKGQKSGAWTFYHSNGQVRAEGNYRNDEKDGVWTSYYSSGDTYAIQYYENGNPIELKAFYNSGDSALIRKYKQEENYLEIQHRDYYKAGPIHETYTARIDHQDSVLLELQHNGFEREQLYYYSNVPRELLVPKTSFRFDGSYQKFHSTGPIWEHFLFDDGKLVNVLLAQDKWEGWRSFGSFENGSGKLIRYHASGDTASIESYESGFKNGSFYYYETKQRLRQKGQWCEGKACGNWLTFNTDLKFEEIITFETPKKYTIREYERKNHLDAIAPYQDHRLHGQRISFNQYDDTASYLNFSFGKLEGVQAYFENGVLYQRGKCKRDVRILDWRTYNLRGKVSFLERLSSNAYWNYSINKPIYTLYQWMPSDEMDFSLAFTQEEVYQDYLEEITSLINGRFFRVNKALHRSDGDVVFRVDLENTGQVRSLECVKFGDQLLYDEGKKLLEGMFFAIPKTVLGIPQDSAFLISIYFEPI